MTTRPYVAWFSPEQGSHGICQLVTSLQNPRTSVPLHSIGSAGREGQPKFKRAGSVRVDWTPYLMWEAACGYRKGRNGGWLSLETTHHTKWPTFLVLHCPECMTQTILKAQPLCVSTEWDWTSSLSSYSKAGLGTVPHQQKAEPWMPHGITGNQIKSKAQPVKMAE